MSTLRVSRPRRMHRASGRAPAFPDAAGRSRSRRPFLNGRRFALPVIGVIRETGDLHWGMARPWSRCWTRRSIDHEGAPRAAVRPAERDRHIRRLPGERAICGRLRPSRERARDRCPSRAARRGAVSPRKRSGSGCSRHSTSPTTPDGRRSPHHARRRRMPGRSTSKRGRHHGREYLPDLPICRSFAGQTRRRGGRRSRSGPTRPASRPRASACVSRHARTRAARVPTMPEACVDRADHPVLGCVVLQLGIAAPPVPRPRRHRLRASSGPRRPALSSITGYRNPVGPACDHASVCGRHVPPRGRRPGVLSPLTQSGRAASATV